MRNVLTLIALLSLPSVVMAQLDEGSDSIRSTVSFLEDRPDKGLPEKTIFIPRSIRDFRLYNSDGTKADSKTTKSQIIMTTKENNISEIKIELPHDVYYEGPPLELKETRHPFANDYNYSGIIPLTNRSWVSGGSYRTTIPTTGAVATATAIYNRMLTDKLLVSGGATVSKYALHSKQYGETTLSAQVAYRFNNQMNLSLFGDYSIQRKDGGLGSFMDRMYPEIPGQIGYGFRPVSSAGIRFDYQVTDWLVINPGLYANRYEFFNNHFSDYGINGHIGIDAHERVTFHLRGQYSLRYGNQGTSVMLRQTMYPQNMYGGGIEFKVNETFSVEAGVNRELNPWTGKWENKPYIMPRFRIK